MTAAAMDQHAGLIVLDPDAADTWVEEDERAYGSPRCPHHRVDTFRSSRHVQFVVDDRFVAETLRPVLRTDLAIITGYLAVAGELPGVDPGLDGNMEKHR